MVSLEQRERWHLRWGVTGSDTVDTADSLQRFQWCHSFFFCREEVADQKQIHEKQVVCMFMSCSICACECVWRVCQAGLSLHKTGPVFTVFHPSGVFWASVNAGCCKTCRDQTLTNVTFYYCFSLKSQTIFSSHVSPPRPNSAAKTELANSW